MDWTLNGYELSKASAESGNQAWLKPYANTFSFGLVCLALAIGRSRVSQNVSGLLFLIWLVPLAVAALELAGAIL